MPHRSHTHIVADMALDSVMHICIQCGWACEVVHKDYGEDILVQTSHKGVIDHSRIWIQVKGTERIDRYYSKKYGYSMDVSLGHALKWVRSADLVIVVLWDVTKNFGLWSIPKYCVNEWDWFLLQTKKSRLIFNESSLFDLENAIKLSWIARFDHYQSLLLNALNTDLAHLRSTLRNNERGIDYKNRSPLIAYDFLRLIQVIDEEFLSKEFLGHYQDGLFKYEGEKLAKGMATMRAILMMSELTSNKACGFPETLLLSCYDVVAKLLQIIEE